MADKPKEPEDRRAADRQAELARQDRVNKAIAKHNAESYAEAQRVLAEREHKDTGL